MLLKFKIISILIITCSLNLKALEEKQDSSETKRKTKSYSSWENILADKKKHVYDEDIIALVDDSLIKESNVINLKSLKVYAGTGEPQKAEMTLEVYGDVKKASETGDGPVDAIFKCIKKLYPHEVKLQLYQVHAVTEGTDAQATVSVRIEEKGKTTVGQAADTDTLVASANAYLNALNKMIIKREKTAPEEYEQEKMKGI